MKKWEYQVLTVKNGPENLNSFGSAGWELVSVCSYDVENGDGTAFACFKVFFKRPVTVAETVTLPGVATPPSQARVGYPDGTVYDLRDGAWVKRPITEPKETE